MRIVIILVFIYFINSIDSFAQTYISPLIGLDFAKMKNQDHVTSLDYLLILDKGYVIESPTIGLKVKQNIFNNVFLTISAKYSYKRVNADRYNLWDLRGFKYDYFHNNAIVHYSFPDFSIGAGVSYNFLSNLKHGYQTAGRSYKISEKGLIFSIGKTLKNFEAELYYYKGLSTINIKGLDLYLNPLISFGLNFSYSIKVLNGFNKDLDCPKF